MMRTRRNVSKSGIIIGRKLVVSILLAASFFLQGLMTAYGAEKPEHLVSATYCSDAWVINFWNSESNRMEEELAQIKEDGFNSIILVVPWREFQPTTNPVSYNPYAWEKLHKVMEAAGKQDLWVILRVGYTWDYYDGDSVLPRFEALLYSEGGTKDAWLAYAEKLHQEMSAYVNYYGGFITWEDFWNFTGKAGTVGNGQASIRLAKQVGYQDYLEKYYTLEIICQIYQEEFASFENIYLPKRSDHAYLLFFRFYDDFLSDLLLATQEVYPNLSMEVRLDVDPVVSEDGQSNIGIPHYSTFGCGTSNFTAAMYGVSMGHGFGKELEAEETIETLKSALAVMRSYNGGKPVYLDQFLYMDTTEEFAHNAQLKIEERPKFLTMSAPVLKSMTMGYGIWTYRNYTDNAVYNAQFALGSSGWTCTSGCQIIEKDGNKVAEFTTAKASLSQNLSRLKSGNNSVRVRFTAESDLPVDITVSIGEVSKIMQVSGKKQVELNFGRIASTGTLRFQTSGNAVVDNINVFTYEQDGQLYGPNGEELSCLDAMRGLNFVFLQ